MRAFRRIIIFASLMTDAEWAKEIAEAVQCDDLAEYFKTDKAGTQIPCWE